MSQRTVFKCDKCDHESEDKTKFEDVHIAMGGSGYYGKSPSGNFTMHNKEFLLCKKCLLAIGIVKAEKKEMPPEMGTAEQLYEIIYNIVCECMPNQ